MVASMAPGERIFHFFCTCGANLQIKPIAKNINRNVILDELPTLKNQLSSSGLLLISGILWSDWDLIMDKALSQGLNLVSKNQKGDWMMGVFSR